MKKIILLLFILFPVAVYAEVLPDVPVKSITRGADKVKYAGSVSAGVAVMFPYVNTSHGVIFPAVIFMSEAVPNISMLEGVLSMWLRTAGGFILQTARFKAM